MKQVPTTYCDGSGARVMRTLARAVDRWGREVWIDFERWQKGRPMLTAYNADGATRWEKGRAYYRAQVYCRENLQLVDAGAA